MAYLFIYCCIFCIYPVVVDCNDRLTNHPGKQYDESEALKLSSIGRRMSFKLISVSFEVFGKVQGVWFRKYTKNTANKYGLKGWVKNTDHSPVQGCIQGPEEDINQMKNWLRSIGSPKSRIDRCEFNGERSIDGFDFNNFNIVK